MTVQNKRKVANSVGVILIAIAGVIAERLTSSHDVQAASTKDFQQFVIERLARIEEKTDTLQKEILRLRDNRR